MHRNWHNALFRSAVRRFAIAAIAIGGGLPLSAREMVREDARPAPSSSLSKADALALASLWKQTSPQTRDYCEVGATGSMAPVLDSRSILLLERITASDLRKNDISIYVHSAELTTCHRVLDVRPEGVLFSGDNNSENDGWIQPDRVRWRVVGILFTRRDVPPSEKAPRAAMSSAARATDTKSTASKPNK